MSETGKARLCNGLDPGLAAATAQLIQAELADVTRLDDQMLGAVLVWALNAKDQQVHAAVYPESEIRSLLCWWCASLVRRSPAPRERWTVVHEAECLLWQRWQQRAGGYTLVPSGELWHGRNPWPAGAERALGNHPGTPCGAVVTWRGPYATQERQQAAEQAAVRKGAGRVQAPAQVGRR